MRHENATFNNDSIAVDENEFIDCTFNKCTLVYNGGQPPTVENCSFNGLKVTFTGPAANTIIFMRGLYSGGFAEIMEATFDNIRGNLSGGKQGIVH